MTPEESAALDIARRLAAAGIPVFVAAPDPSSSTGYALPVGWQHTPADPRAVDAWRPGMALAMVCGHGLDLLDVDPRSGGDPNALNGSVPVSYGAAATPSGGVHSFIRSLGVRSRNGVLPGIDVKAGDAAGEGRGFAFIAPTVRTSKVTGQPVTYRWAVPPDLARLTMTDDTSGGALAALVQGERAGTAPNVDGFMKAGPWADIPRALAQGRNNGVARLAASLRGRGGWRLEDATDYMYAKVWPQVDQNQGGHEFLAEEFEATIRAAWRQYADGAAQRAIEAATPPAPGAAPNPARYFNQNGGLLGATLASDVIAGGPLAEGVDDRMWRYAEGVWRPDKHVVRDRVVWMLGEKYKRHAASTADDIVRARVDTIDCRPVEQYINFRNGLLDWRTGELHPHTPAVLSTVQLAVEYNPDAACPRFDQFLSEVVPADMADVVWELVGYLMYSGNPLHKAVMLTGKGRNGKGTFLRAMTALLDVRNITSVSLADLVSTRFSTASLFGKLANIAGDIDGGYLENTATFKAITGGDTISAEHKGRDRFDFTPWAVPVFSANKIPASADASIGYLSRWLVVPFPNSFRGREDHALDHRLSTSAELTGIAAKGVPALARLLQRGDFAQTDSGRAAAAEFTRRVDQVRTWLHDCCDLHPEHPWVNRTELYQVYQRWAARDGHRPVRASEFYERLEDAGAVPVKRSIRGYTGVKVLDQAWGYQGAVPTAGSVGSENQQRSVALTPKKTAPSVITDDDLQSATCPQQKPRSEPKNVDQAGSMGSYPTTPRTHARAREAGLQHLPMLPVPAHDDKINEPRPADGEAGSPVVRVRAEAKQAARAQSILEAAGPLVPLPAQVDRAGLPRAVTLDAVGSVLAAVITTAGALTVDVETSGYPVGHADHVLRTVQLGDETAAVVLDAADPAQAEVARIALAAAPRLYAHSATADLVPLRAAGLVDESAWARMHDTVIPAKLADPRSTGSDPGLKQLAPAVLGESAVTPPADAARAALFKAAKWLTDTEATTPVQRSGWAQVDPACTTMVRYAAADVLDTAALAVRLPELPAAVVDRERAVQRITARVAYHGLRIDGEHVARLRVEHGAARDAAHARVTAFGIENPGSDRQVATALTQRGVSLPYTKPSARYPDGQPSVAAGVLETFRGTPGEAGPLVAAVLDYRHHETVLTTFLEPYHQLVTRGDGRARPTVYTLGTDTGRMSCVRPNLQQLPREGHVRACITADDGKLLISADFSGVELRVAAALSGDTNLARMIAAGDDLHWRIAREVWGPDATKADRYAAKRIVFGRLYGGGVPTLARQSSVSEGLAASAVDVLDAVTPGLSAWSAGLRDQVRRGTLRYVPTYSGRVIWLPREYPHKAPNYAIQGSARELLVDALLRWEATPWGGGVVLPVHDEIVAVVPAGEAAEATRALVACMTSDLAGVAIVAEAGAPAQAWQDAV